MHESIRAHKDTACLWAVCDYIGRTVTITAKCLLKVNNADGGNKSRDARLYDFVNEKTTNPKRIHQRLLFEDEMERD